MSDLVTFGETRVRLSPPQGSRLSRVDQFDVHVGGAESNVAVAASALGTETTWLSALPETALGERIAHALRGEGVDPRVTWTPDGRVGTYYFEPGGDPRGATVVYDRTGTPMRDVTPDDLAVDAVRDATLCFTSGITPALSDQAAATTESLLATAQEAGATTTLDVNYRSKLWTQAEARETLVDLFEHVELLFVAERDARNVLDGDGDGEAIARTLASTYDFDTVVVTRGEAGALAVSDGVVCEQPAFETDTIDPVGSGDAFVGGYLARHLDGESVSEALRWGAATAALKRTLAGDMATISASEIRAVLQQDGRDSIDR